MRQWMVTNPHEGNSWYFEHEKYKGMIGEELSHPLPNEIALFFPDLDGGQMRRVVTFDCTELTLYHPGSDKAVDPISCEHLGRHNICGAQGDVDNYHVTICPRCGEFDVTGWTQGGERYNVKFTLGNQRLLEAAAQWLQLIDKVQGESKIVCLCGSTRFYDEFMRANYQETMQGNIVIMPGVFGHSLHSDRPITDECKQRLDALHLEKIAMSDRVLVINPGGYIGTSTQHEIKYARQLGKPVFYWNDDGE